MERDGGGMHPWLAVPLIGRRVKGRWWFLFKYVKIGGVKVLKKIEKEIEVMNYSIFYIIRLLNHDRV